MCMFLIDLETVGPISITFSESLRVGPAGALVKFVAIGQHKIKLFQTKRFPLLSDFTAH